MLRCLAAGVLLAVAAGAAFGRGIVERGSGNLVAKDYAISDFDGFDVSGSWDVRISRGAYRISVEVDDNILKYVEVQKRGGTLFISTKGARILPALY